MITSKTFGIVLQGTYNKTSKWYGSMYKNELFVQCTDTSWRRITCVWNIERSRMIAVTKHSDMGTNTTPCIHIEKQTFINNSKNKETIVAQSTSIATWDVSANYQ
eukprot:269536_1